jgi:PAS domain-containing protein
VARFTSAEEIGLRDIEAALGTFVEGRLGLADAMAPLRELLGTAKTAAYAIRPRGQGLAVGFMYGDNVPLSTFAPAFDAWLSDKTFGWTGYNPIRPEPSQRNVVVDKREIARWHDPRTSPIVREMFPRLGVADDDQLRVLVCDGASLLAWVGAFQPGRFDARQKRLLRRLVPALRRRLIVERAVASGPHLRATLDAALEAIGAAAFVLNGSGGVAEANEAGRLLLAADRAGTLDALRESVRRPGASAVYGVSAITAPGMPDERLAIARRLRRRALVAHATAGRGARARRAGATEPHDRRHARHRGGHRRGAPHGDLREGGRA